MKKILCFVLMACTLAGCDYFSERSWNATPAPQDSSMEKEGLYLAWKALSAARGY